MPVSHIGLTVSHLPTSCSFFLAALSPLGYKYFGQQNNQIGFGVNQADFFICQDSPGTKAGAAHIAFEAPSKRAVDDFFHAALKAGAKVHGEPGYRDSQTDAYNAAVIDFDDNSIEVVYRDRQEWPSAAGENGGSQWQKVVSRTTISTSRSVQESAQETVHPLRTIVQQFITAPATPTQVGTSDNSKALIGTILGAVAGAAITYAMTRGDSQSLPTPPTTPQRQPEQVYQIEAPRSEAPRIEAPRMAPRSVTYSEYPRAPTQVPSQRSYSFEQSRPQPLAIEAAPYPASTFISTFVPPSEVLRPVVPIPTTARSSYNTIIEPAVSHRSRHSPPPTARSTVSRRSSHHSPPTTARSHASHYYEQSPPPTPQSTTSRHSQPSTPKSEHSHHSHHTSHSPTRSTHSKRSSHYAAPSQAPLPPSTIASSVTVTPRTKHRSAAPSIVPSRAPVPVPDPVIDSDSSSDSASAITVTRRSSYGTAHSHISSRSKARSEILDDGIDDAISLAPCDSVSQIGSRSSRSRRSGGGSSEAGEKEKKDRSDRHRAMFEEDGKEKKKKGERRRKEKSGRGNASLVTAPVGAGTESVRGKRSIVSFF